MLQIPRHPVGDGDLISVLMIICCDDIAALIDYQIPVRISGWLLSWCSSRGYGINTC